MEKFHQVVDKYVEEVKLKKLISVAEVNDCWKQFLRGVASKYINRYTALFVLVREYVGCTLWEILINTKGRLRQFSDYFRVVDMKNSDLFYYCAF